MRLLLVTPFLPDRHAAHGGGVYLSSLIEGLSRRAALGLVTLVHAGETARLIGPGVPWQRAAAVPHLERGRGLSRWGHQLRMLWRWRQAPLVAAKHWQPRLPGLIAQFIAQWRPDAALVEMAQMAQYLPWLRGMPTILTDHEAGCPSNTTTGLGRTADRRDRGLWRQYVRRFYPMATRVQAVTQEDASTLSALLGSAVAVRPPSLLLPPEPVQPANAPPRALFLGDYRHQPNPEAAGWLSREVLPQLRRRDPNIELWLAGPHCDRLAALSNLPGVRVVGFRDDVRSLFAQVRMVLAPVFSGGGVRMKGLTALAHGVPVVTNALGARGPAVPPAARQVVEGAEALTTASLRWLTSAGAAATAGSAAFAWARDHLSPAAVAAAQLAQIEALLP